MEYKYFKQTRTGQNNPRYKKEYITREQAIREVDEKQFRRLELSTLRPGETISVQKTIDGSFVGIECRNT